MEININLILWNFFTLSIKKSNDFLLIFFVPVNINNGLQWKKYALYKYLYEFSLNKSDKSFDFLKFFPSCVF